MRLVFRTRLPEARLRAAMRRAAAGAVAALAKRAEAHGMADVGRLPATSMLPAALRHSPWRAGGGVEDFAPPKIDEN